MFLGTDEVNAVDRLGLINTVDVENPATRVPICICVDRSGSMYGDPMNELNEGIKLLHEDLLGDEISSQSAEICVVTFGEDVKCVQEFDNLDNQEILTDFEAHGGTPLGEALNLAVDKIEERVTKYRNAGIEFFSPWVVVLTDGRPNGDAEELNRAVNRVRDLALSKDITVFPIAIGDQASMSVLNKLSPGRPAIKLKGIMFKEFFIWLSSSVQITSASSPTEQIMLPSVGTWAQV